MKYCKECRMRIDAYTEADFQVVGIKAMDDLTEVPYIGTICEAHLGYLQDHTVEFTEVVPLAKVA